MKIAPATGWPAGATPTAAQGLQVQAFATGLEHPRWLYVLPNGDVLVAETNRPPTEDPPAIRSAVTLMKQAFEKAGAAVPSAERITLLRDADGDGMAETRTAFLQGLTSPFGMALVGDTFYVANTDAIVHVPYKTGDTRSTATPVKLADLPGGPRNHHWTKGLLASRGRQRSCTSASAPTATSPRTAWTSKPDARRSTRSISGPGKGRVFASGLRNPVGLAWEPQTKALWTVVNERDEMGSDLVPDYLTSVKDGAFYGWPWSYYGEHVDTRVEPPRPDMVAKAIAPDYALGPHVASLGLAFYTGDRVARALPPTARSSACTARGTAIRRAATRWSSCRSRTAGPRARRKTC